MQTRNLYTGIGLTLVVLLMATSSVAVQAQHHGDMHQDEMNHGEGQDHAQEVEVMKHKIRSMAKRCYQLSMSFRSMAAQTDDSTAQQRYNMYEQMGNSMSTTMTHLSMMTQNMQEMMADSATMGDPERAHTMTEMQHNIQSALHSLEESLRTMENLHSNMHHSDEEMDTMRHHESRE